MIFLFVAKKCAKVVTGKIVKKSSKSGQQMVHVKNKKKLATLKLVKWSKSCLKVVNKWSKVSRKLSIPVQTSTNGQRMV